MPSRLTVKRFSNQGVADVQTGAHTKRLRANDRLNHSGFRVQIGPAGGTIKRIFDIVAAAVIILLLAPLFLGLAALIAVTSRGRALYGHTRVGYDNRPFDCLKFRTMAVNGDEILSEHLERNPMARIEWEETMKLRDDPRVTTVGQVLRKLSLDELPQLFNVLKGEMSLVGPRPVKADELSRYGRSTRYYIRARPGITGLWQVSGRNTTSYRRRIACDRAYVARHSDAIDAMILAKTLPAVLRSEETS